MRRTHGERAAPYPLSARLLPRLARTQKVCFFVQVLPLGQHAARQGLRGILREPEIVQECADLCGDFKISGEVNILYIYLYINFHDTQLIYIRQ